MEKHTYKRGSNFLSRQIDFFWENLTNKLNFRVKFLKKLVVELHIYIDLDFIWYKIFFLYSI
jgi:hypothetical protein